MAKPHSALAVANFFLGLARSKGASLDPMKLQKLIYFSHGWDLALFDRPLIDEQIQAWEYGPIVQSVYHEFKSFGADPITRLGTDYDYANRELVIPRIPLDDDPTIKLLSKVWDIYGGYTAIQLSHLTHLSDSAWSKVRGANEEKRFVGIPDDDIKAEFWPSKTRRKLRPRNPLDVIKPPGEFHQAGSAKA